MQHPLIIRPRISVCFFFFSFILFLWIIQGRYYFHFTNGIIENATNYVIYLRTQSWLVGELLPETSISPGIFLFNSEIFWDISGFAPLSGSYCCRCNFQVSSGSSSWFQRSLVKRGFDKSVIATYFQITPTYPGLLESYVLSKQETRVLALLPQVTFPLGNLSPH